MADRSGTILNVNKALCSITGFSRDEVIGRNPRIMRSDRHDDSFYAAMWRAVLEEGFWQGEVWDRKKTGEVYPKWLTINTVFDELTGLPNRTLFRERLTRQIAGAKRLEHRMALLFLDLDRFKEINDTLGHDSGDGLLRRVSSRLTSAVLNVMISLRTSLIRDLSAQYDRRMAL